MKKLDRISRTCATLTGFTSHQQCFLEPHFSLNTQGCRIALFECMQLIIVWLHNTQNNVVYFICRHTAASNSNLTCLEMSYFIGGYFKQLVQTIGYLLATKKCYCVEWLRAQLERQNLCTKLREKLDIRWPWQDQYDLLKHGDYDWVKNTVYNLVREYEAGNLLHDHLEGWYNVHIWRFFDTIFDVLKNIEVSRGEPPSKASAERKNEKRRLGAIETIKRKKIGHRCDSIIQRITASHEPGEEFGASEVAKKHDKFSSKSLYERDHKLPKTLRDMFNSLCSSHPQLVRQLETVGYIHQGLSCQLLRLDSPDGYVARISHLPEGDSWVSLASTIDEFACKSIPVILLAWHAKEIVSKVLESIAKTEEPHASNSLSLDNVFVVAPRTIIMPRCSTSKEIRPKKNN